MRAALVTAIMRGLVEELMPMAGEPGRFLAEINRSLHAILRRTREPFLATAFYVIADVAAGKARFSSAGHPSPILIHRQTSAVDLLKAPDSRHGPAMGLFERPQFPTCHCPLAASDLILLFTDGLYEVDNSQQEEYGLQRLLESAKRRTAEPTDRLIQGLLADVRAFSGGAEFADDVCVVGVDINRVGVKI
jgi:sigma-B regulation protein RsbU (phosphoserine phosphatase)